jgi:hypothetical protein
MNISAVWIGARFRISTGYKLVPSPCWIHVSGMWWSITTACEIMLKYNTFNFMIYSKKIVRAFDKIARIRYWIQNVLFSAVLRIDSVSISECMKMSKLHVCPCMPKKFSQQVSHTGNSIPSHCVWVMFQSIRVTNISRIGTTVEQWNNRFISSVCHQPPGLGNKYPN